MENDPLASGQSVGFLRWYLTFLLHFVLLVHLPLRLITSPSHSLTYVLLAPFNFLPLHNSH